MPVVKEFLESIHTSRLGIAKGTEDVKKSARAADELA
jgi:hypothetical protein